MAKKKPVKDANTRWPQHSHDLVHTFGVEDYDAYWNAAPMRKGMRSVHKRMVDEIKALVPGPARLLELGPGPGHLFKALEAAGYEMYACDASQVALDRLDVPPERKQLANLNSGLPDYGVKFRVILAAMVLHHIDKPEPFLGQLRKAVAPDGYVVLTVPNIITLKNRMRMLAGEFPDLSPSHRNFMTPSEVKKLLARAQLKSVRVLSARRKPLHMISPMLFSKELIVIAQA